MLGIQTDSLSHHHYVELKSSAIADEVIVARGYRSIDGDEAKALGYKGKWARSGLLIPLRNIEGEISGYQLKPDDPPISLKGKPIKYLTLPKQPNRLDIPPTIRKELPKGRQAVFITEGCKKADALATLGIPTISLTGVYNWLGKNADGGYTPLVDWEDINIRGNAFVIAFDSDIRTNYNVYRATNRLKRWLEHKGAYRVGILNLHNKGAEKMGVDDYLAQIYTR